MKLKPKFLHPIFVMNSAQMVSEMLVTGASPFKPKRNAFHVVMLVPELEVLPEQDIMDTYPHYPVRPVILAEYSLNKEEWTADYQDIARCKAFKLWHDMNDGRTDILPHLMYSGECPFYGGVKREGIVTACSGVQPWFDRMIAGMVTDMCIAASYNAWMTSEDRGNDVDNLT